jgi:hypothetical protein
VGNTFAAILSRMRDARRRSIRDADALAPELREREDACKAIDTAIARATSFRIEERPQGADGLAADLVPWLRPDSRRARASSQLVDTIIGEESPTYLAAWSWLTRWQPGGDRIVRSVAWDGDGRCLAATSRGLAFWNGTEWLDAPSHGLGDAAGIRFVRRVRPGTWIVGGDAATVAMYTADRTKDIIRGSDSQVRFDLFDGDIEDVAILAGAAPGGPPSLCALVAGRWIKPLTLPGVAALTSLARIDDTSWLLTGRDREGKGFVAVYSPLEWSVQTVRTPRVRAFLAAAGHPDRRVGLAVGADGAVVWQDRGQVSNESIRGRPDLSAAGVDVGGRGWAAGAGQIWLRQPGESAQPWSCVWEDESWSAPMVSMFADVGMVIAVTADGGIVEGRLAMLEMSATGQYPAGR